MFDPVRESVPAQLILENGTVFQGRSCGARGQAFGEVVFNTSMTGYQEILTDPSYCGQMIAFTYPHIGNQGINERDNESRAIWTEGVIVRDLVSNHSNYRAHRDLYTELMRQGVVGISEVNTRALTHLLREKGSLRGMIHSGVELTPFDLPAVLKQLQDLEPLSGQDLTPHVSTKTPYAWTEHSEDWAISARQLLPVCGKTVVVYDFGIKYSTLRLLKDRGLEVMVVPARTSVSEVRAFKPDGILLSNGPGDPAACMDLIELIRELIQQNWPMLGICLGHQLLALASGAETFKMKFGQHGANHPVQNIKTRQIRITSQNHGFAVDPETLPAFVKPTHWALFDGTLQGFQFTDRPILGFQGHPEAGPGPHEMVEIIDQFVQLL